MVMIVRVKVWARRSQWCIPVIRPLSLGADRKLRSFKWQSRVFRLLKVSKFQMAILGLSIVKNIRINDRDQDQHYMVLHIARIIGSSMVWECCTSKPAIWSRRIYPAWRQMRKSAVRWWVALDTESCAYIGPGQHWTTAYVTRRYTPIACILLGMVHTPSLCASSLTEIARCSTSRRCGLCATSNQRPSGVWCSLCCSSIQEALEHRGKFRYFKHWYFVL